MLERRRETNRQTDRQKKRKIAREQIKRMRKREDDIFAHGRTERQAVTETETHTSHTSKYILIYIY